jgi:hypothetical protein
VKRSNKSSVNVNEKPIVIYYHDVVEAIHILPVVVVCLMLLNVRPVDCEQGSVNISNIAREFCEPRR